MINLKYAGWHSEPFNGDYFINEEFLKIKKKFNIVNAVETGSCTFSTTKWLGENFENVFTFEHNKDFYDEYIGKISDLPNIKSFNTKSVEGLNLIIDELNGPTVFYLDAHWDNECPINEEIEVISNYKFPHVIVIHDFKTNNPELGYDSFYFDGGFDLDLNLIYGNLEKIYPDGVKFYYNKNAVGGKRGVIYILPY